ncbi:hypothetical protein C7M84_024434 [Penaeus vannamei]|uniref:Uncharacterized protein n=1 Tax=Penaeus vannamei TaxID=6689 RepID=A0A423U139_PENVA|nr:hypothetical protein C7M84_024434 [Penaeus vannamei]
MDGLLGRLGVMTPKDRKKESPGSHAVEAREVRPRGGSSPRYTSPSSPPRIPRGRVAPPSLPPRRDENPPGKSPHFLAPRRKADTLAAQRSPRAPSQAEAQDSPPDQRTLHTFHHDDMASPSPPPTFRLVQKTEKDPRSRPLEPQKRGSSEVSPTTEKERLSERHPSAARDSAARSLDPRAHPIPLPHQDDMHVLLGRTIRVRVQQTATRQTQEVTLSPRTKHPGKLHPRAREETQEAPLDAPTKRTPGNSTSGARPPRKETGRGSGAGTPPPRQLTLRAQNGNPKSPLPSPEQEPRSHQSRRKRAQESRRERIHRPFPQRYECLLGRLQGRYDVSFRVRLQDDMDGLLGRFRVDDMDGLLGRLQVVQKTERPRKTIWMVSSADFRVDDMDGLLGRLQGRRYGWSPRPTSGSYRSTRDYDQLAKDIARDIDSYLNSPHLKSMSASLNEEQRDIKYKQISNRVVHLITEIERELEK